jgi:hypothetical protein
MPHQKAFIRHGDADRPASPEGDSPETITGFSLVSPFHTGKSLHGNAMSLFHKFLTFSSVFVTKFF